ncbi:DUF3261 domain-containing protein [Shewanella sp. A3A]|nr:DUF3261 domain-containing protein [Shewanella ferrihydritica]
MMRWLLCCAVLLLSGCQSLQQSSDNCVALSEQVQQCLAPLPWSASGQPLVTELLQQLSVDRADSHHELTSSLEFTPTQMTVVGIAPLGQALFTVQYDGSTLTSQQSLLLGDNFRPDYLMAMLQLIYWPQTMLDKSITGAKLSEGRCDEQRCRRLTRGNQLIAEIRYQQPDAWHSAVVLHLPIAKLQLTIQPL